MSELRGRRRNESRQHEENHLKSIRESEEGMSENLEVAKKIIRAYWREVMSDAEYRRSGMSYNDIVATLLYLDDDMEKHIKAVASIMSKALKEIQKEKNEP